jgi:hypothetical protein
VRDANALAERADKGVPAACSSMVRSDHVSVVMWTRHARKFLVPTSGGFRFRRSERVSLERLTGIPKAVPALCTSTSGALHTLSPRCPQGWEASDGWDLGGRHTGL